MKFIQSLVVLCVMAFQIQVGAQSDENSNKNIKNVSVNGMVCSFCSTSLEKKFKNKEEISKIQVDLDKQNVQLTFKEGKRLSNEDIRKIIKSSGFDVVDIQ